MSEVNTSRVAVIMVNYKTAELACRALKSLAEERQFLPELSAVVVDNQSPDDSYQVLTSFVSEQGFSEWATIVHAEKNGGYAYGNNKGIKTYQQTHEQAPDYYWLLNPDTYVRPKAGLSLVEFLEDNTAAIVGSRLEDDDGTPQISTFNFPSGMSETLSGFGLGILDRIFARHRVTRDIPQGRERVDWVAGASFMLPNAVVDRVGLMDDEYFLYFEEVDYCLQIQRAGFSCWYVPESRVMHEMGAATGISDVRKAQPRRPQYWFDSRRRYFSKNHGWLHLFFADTGWALGYSFWCLRKWLTGSEDLSRQPPYLLRDFLRNSVFNPFK